MKFYGSLKASINYAKVKIFFNYVISLLEVFVKYDYYELIVQEFVPEISLNGIFILF
jgi:hypothetical protein